MITWYPKTLCKKDCGNVVNNKHIEVAQRMPCGKKPEKGDQRSHKQSELYIIPELLVIELMENIVNNI